MNAKPEPPAQPLLDWLGANTVIEIHGNEATYVHADNCPSFCDYACNGAKGRELAAEFNAALRAFAEREAALRKELDEARAAFTAYQQSASARHIADIDTIAARARAETAERRAAVAREALVWIVGMPEDWRIRRTLHTAEARSAVADMASEASRAIARIDALASAPAAPDTQAAALASATLAGVRAGIEAAAEYADATDHVLAVEVRALDAERIAADAVRRAAEAQTGGM